MIEEDLLAAVMARPDDDGARLVHADWLMQDGHPRGEFIAVQCTLASGVDDAASEQRLRRRARALLAKHAKAWLAPLGLSPAQVSWRRGHIDSVELTSERLLVLWPELVRTTPLTRVRVSDLASAGVAALGQLAWPAQLTCLSLYFRRSPRDLESLLASPELRHLTALELPFCVHGAGGLDALRRGLVLPRLTRLDLSHNLLGDAGVAQLLDTPRLPALTELDLRGNELGLEAVGRIAASSNLALTTLRLGENRVGDRGLARLAGAPSMARLRVLDLHHASIGGAGVAALAGLPELERLGLAFNNVDDAAVRALAGRTSLRGLDLSANQIGSQGPAALAELAGLTRLSLSQNPIGSQGVEPLTSLTRLRELRLASCRIADSGALALARAAFPELRILELKGNALGDGAFAELAAASYLGQLGTLTLAGNPIAADWRARLLARRPELAEAIADPEWDHSPTEA